jgi:PAS domain S-box-containing protein
LQELLKKHASFTGDIDTKTVTVFVQSSLYTLAGSWQWELASDAVFCSDVMFNLPEDIIATKGIIHPDDIETLHRGIYYRDVIGEDDTSDVQFRMITSYGEVKTLTGKNIRFVKRELDSNIENPAELLFKTTALQTSVAKEHKLLSLRTAIADFSEKIHHTASWYFNLSTAEAFYSDNYYRLFGLPPQTLNAQAHTFASFIHLEDKDVVLEAIEKSYREKLPLEIEYRIIRADGELRYVQHSSKLDFSEAGQEIVYGVVKDITEQKQKEIQLEEADNLLKMQNKVAEFTEATANVGHWMVDILTRKFSFSDNYYRIFGFKPSELTPSLTVITEVVHPDDRESFKELHRRLILQTTIPDFEFRIIKRDGKIRHLLLKGKLVVTENSEMVVVGTIKDITYERNVEKKLKDVSREIFVKDIGYNAAEQMSASASWIYDTSTGKITPSANLFSLIGAKKDPGEFTPKSLLKYVYPADRDKFSYDAQLMSEDVTANDFEFRLLTRGDTKLFKASFKSVFEEGNKFIVCAIHDVTELQVLAQKLEEKVHFNEALSENVRDKIIAVDAHYSIIEWNKACEVSFGKSRSDVFYHNFFDVFPDARHSDFTVYFSRAFNGESLSEDIQPTTYLKGYHTVRFLPLRDQKGNINGVLLLMTDKTQETELQQHLTYRLSFIESIVDASIDPLIVLDKHLNYTHWNKACERLFRVNKEYIVGKNILDIMPVAMTNPTAVQFKRVLQGDTIYLPAEESEDGTFYEVCLVPIKDLKNQVTGVLWMIRNLANELTLLKHQRKATEVLEAIKEPSFELDKDAVFTYVNNQAEALWGKKKEDLLGKQIWDVFPAALGTGGYHIITEALTENKKVQGEYFSEVVNKYLFMSAMPFETGVIVLFYDISDMRREQHQLQEEHRRLKQAEAVGHVGSFEWEASTGKIYWSDEMYRIHGLEPQSQEITFDTVLSFVDKGFLPDAIEKMKRCRTEVCRTTIIHRIRRADGEFRMVNRQIQSFADETGNVNHLNGTVQDITEQVVAQQKLEQRETELQRNLAILKQSEQLSKSGSWEYEIATGCFNCSEGLYQIFRMKKGTRLTAETHLDQVVKEDRPLAEEIVKNVKEGFQPFEETLRIKIENEVRTFKIKCVVVNNTKGEPERLLGVDMDITEMVRAEEKVRESEHLLKQTAEATPDAVTIFDLVNNQPTYLNRRLAEWVGTTTEDLIQMGMEGRINFVHADDRLRLRQFNDRVAIADTNELLTTEYRIRGKENQWLWICNRSKVFRRDKYGNTTQIFSILQDITLNKTILEELQQKQAFLEQVTDNTPTLIYVYDLEENQFDFVNKRIFDLCGLTEDRMYSMGPHIFNDVLHPEDVERRNSYITNLSTIKEGEIRTFEFRLKVGIDYKWFRFKEAIFNSENGVVKQVIGVGEDITYEKLIMGKIQNEGGEIGLN